MYKGTKGEPKKDTSVSYSRMFFQKWKYYISNAVNVTPQTRKCTKIQKFYPSFISSPEILSLNSLSPHPLMFFTLLLFTVFFIIPVTALSGIYSKSKNGQVIANTISGCLVDLFLVGHRRNRHVYFLQTSFLQTRVYCMSSYLLLLSLLLLRQCHTF